MTTTIARTEPAAAPVTRRPRIVHLFRPHWWECFLPRRFWQVREGDCALCGAVCNWTNPRGGRHLRDVDICVVCRDLNGKRP